VARSVAENLKKDCRVRLASSANTMSVPYKPESRDFSKNQPARRSLIVNYPIPDYSKVKPKTNSYNTPTSGSEIKEVSSAVACCVFQMEASNLPGTGWKFLFYFLHFGFMLVSCLYLGSGSILYISIVR
jgi:hypothetical protein